MKKRAIIIHCWGGSPHDGFYPWLATELEKNNFAVIVPEMPDTETPSIDAWVSHLAAVVGDADEHTFFVGHSIGCQTIMRYLETLPTDKKIGGAVFIAPWFTLQELESAEEKDIVAPWLTTPIDFEKVTSHTKNFFALFSDDDPFVPLENKKLFEERLGAQTAVEHGKGHFTEGDGAKELPIALEKILLQ